MSALERDTKRGELDAMAAAAIASLIKDNPDIQQELDASLGHAVTNMKVTKIPVVGGGGGEGVFVNKKTDQRIYYTVSRFDIGGSYGARSYKILMVINSQKMLDRLHDGIWEFESGVEVSAGTVSAEGSSGSLNEDYTLHVLSDGGASATATARVIRMEVNDELTD